MHIRSDGNWTTRLYSFFEEKQKEQEEEHMRLHCNNFEEHKIIIDKIDGKEIFTVMVMISSTSQLLLLEQNLMLN